jgi:hypothetical protein
MPPLALLWIALLQLLAPAGSMHPASQPSESSRPEPPALSVAPRTASNAGARVVVVARSGDRCGEHRWNDPESGAAGRDGGRRDEGTASGVRELPDAPMARSGSRPRTGLLTRSPGAAPSRAVASVVAPGRRAPLVGAVATTADRTSRAVAARGRLLGHLPIPPPLG